MTIEEKLRELILMKYNSLRQFTRVIEVPYSTVNTIFIRGINNANFFTIVKMCNELDISLDGVASGQIIHRNQSIGGEKGQN